MIAIGSSIDLYAASDSIVNCLKRGGWGGWQGATASYTSRVAWCDNFGKYSSMFVISLSDL